MKDDEFCFWHSPKTAEKRKAARRRGGSRGKIPKNDSIESIEDVKCILMETINELRSCGTDNIVGKSRATGYLCSIMISAFEKSDLETRVAKLEEMLTTSTT